MIRFYLIPSKEYREDELNCQKLYSNPDMFFETWKDEFIKKMEEEHKKRKEIQKRRKSIRKKQQEEGRRTAKKSEKIVTQAVIKIINKYLPLLIF